jgi:3-methyladenine DNA glycosylase AlkD
MGVDSTDSDVHGADLALVTASRGTVVDVAERPTASLGWADEVVVRSMLVLEPAGDPGRARDMSAYMRDRFPFIGIPTPRRRGLLAESWGDLPEPSPDELAAATDQLWRLAGREYQYAACDLLGRFLGTPRRAHRFGPGFLTSAVLPLLTSKPWWDTVDSLRAVAVGPLVAAHPGLVETMRTWVEDDDPWLVRSAVIHQLGYGRATDEALLLELCARRADDREFFVAKAIGWALRTHARHRPDAVRQFCTDHPELTPLARREALKHL